jgi:hypothetical protein
LEQEREWVAKCLRAGCDLLNVLKRPQELRGSYKPSGGAPGIPIEFQGRTMTINKWSKELGINRQTLRLRLERMTIEEAFTMPVNTNKSLAGHVGASSRYGHDTRSPGSSPVATCRS